MSDQGENVTAAPWIATVEDLEALLFVVDRPITRREAANLLETSKGELDRLVTKLQEGLTERGITLITHGDELQLASGAGQARAVLAWVGTGGSDLTAAPLETLAVIAYRQPVTKAGIEEIRGVDADYALRLLLERGLIEEAGRLETAGRPIRYATTLEFLRRFGLASLSDLPPLQGDAESLRHLELRSEAADPGSDQSDAAGATQGADVTRGAGGPDTPAQEDAATD
jgi:segregation and condensation protein B